MLSGKTHVNFELLQYQLGNLFTSSNDQRIFSEIGLFGFIINEIGFMWRHRFVENFCANFAKVQLTHLVVPKTVRFPCKLLLSVLTISLL